MELNLGMDEGERTGAMGLTIKADADMITDAIRRSSSYTEFKMKMSVSGTDIFTVDALKVIFHQIRGYEMQREFANDLFCAIDRDELSEYALSVIGDSFSNPRKKHKKFDAFIAKVWLRRHKDDYR